MSDLMCQHCGQPVEVYHPTTTGPLAYRFAYYRHVATGRRACLVMREFASIQTAPRGDQS